MLSDLHNEQIIELRFHLQPVFLRESLRRAGDSLVFVSLALPLVLEMPTDQERQV